jgi:hypothetical protein
VKQKREIDRRAFTSINETQRSIGRRVRPFFKTPLNLLDVGEVLLKILAGILLNPVVFKKPSSSQRDRIPNSERSS